jgi:Resolvase, N terminal domain
MRSAPRPAAIAPRAGAGATPTRAPLHRRADVQALAVLVVLSADGAISQALGAPAPLIFVYIVLGLFLAAARLRLGDRRPPAKRAAAPTASVRDRPAPPPPPPPRPSGKIAIGYVRAPEGRADASVRADAVAIAAWCRAHGFELARVMRDPSPAGDAPRAVDAAVDHLAAGAAYALIAAHLADLSDTAAALRSLLARVRAVGGALVAIDVGLDTSTDAGRIAAAALASVEG